MRNAWLPPLARIGLVAKGASFAIVGVLALQPAIGHGGKSTSREGALATLADNGFGKWLLFALAAGFAAYALWRVAKAFFEREEEDKRWGKRAGYLARAAIYTGLAFSAVALKKLAHQSYGPWPLGLTAAGLLAYAAYCFADARYRRV